ncbi:helix-turn-helix transcriptional regulator [Luteolibacter pohnpeiensis]|uniref:Helix-turn-helix transcriptional regulator n=1 Tax=Luteolibacter pohnpeiensis TaxID=454153 RepID=A0A934S583_9BACT|nr:helix-turn-helix transcriptional regulator [Luteolibacter pohnpeiensis]MBK1883330.1 helix-turn-helix transcriptional regulator [Luteolibacter pohnpeiensis]
MDRLREARRVQGLTLRELSGMSGIDAGMISRAERGERWPSLAALLDLSKALDVKVSEILAAEKR